MSFSSRLLALALGVAPLAAPAAAHDGIAVRDGYVIVSGAMAATAAGFLVIENHRAIDDRLVAASSDAAERTELHTHVQDAQGVMRMVEVPEGFVIPAGGERALTRGGDHLMFLGLTRPLAPGDTVTVTLVFEASGPLEVALPVGAPTGGAMPHGHGGHGSGG